MIFPAIALRRSIVVPAIILFSASVYISGNVFAAAADDYSKWSNSTTVTLSTTAAGVTTTQNNFPIVIKLVRGSNFTGFASAKPHGEDIRFVNSIGTHLPYQIERWDSANGLAEVWVKVDQILGSNSTQYIKMLWGNPSAADSSLGSAVFDTANGYQAVWHLGETGTGNTNDATINNFTGTSSGTAKPVDVQGIIGKAKQFDGATGYFDIANSASGKLNFPQAGNYTISGWANPSVVNAAYHDFVSKGDHQYSSAIDATNLWQIAEYKTTVGWVNAQTGSAAAVATWRYFVGVRNGNKISLYMDGAWVSDSNDFYNPTPPAPARIETYNVRIGANAEVGHYFGGIVDELSLANKVRTADWIKLSYENQKPGQSLPTICALPTITTQPSNITNIVAGNPATFTVAATGTNTYQWQLSTNTGATWGNVTIGSGATTNSYTFTTDASMNGYLYRCQITGNSCSILCSNAASLFFCMAPSITSQPADVPNNIAGNTATFSVTASGTVTYLWERNNGAGWVAPGGTATSQSYTLTTSSGDNGAQFHCKVTNSSCGATATSTAATLTVCTPPSTPLISTQPSAWSGPVNTTATYSIVVSSSVTSPTYQWQESTSVQTWHNVTVGSGQAAPTYTFTALASDGGAKLRCAIANGCGSINSNAVGCSVCNPPSISAQPVPQSVVALQNATFFVTVSGDPTLTYKWQNSPDGNAWSATLATTSSYTFQAQYANNGYLYHCIVTNGCGAPDTSSPALLTVCQPPTINTPPANQLNIVVNGTATFSVTASGSPAPTYQWQDSAAGIAHWTDINSATGSSYSRTGVLASDSGMQFRCKVSNGCGNSAYSSAALLTVCTPPAIAVQPVSQSDTAGAGHAATFSVTATGSPTLAFQWQDSVIGVSGWTSIAGATNPTYTFTPASNQDGWKFRCNVSSNSSCGIPILSSAATMSVCTSPSITTQPVSLPNKQVGDSAKFTVVIGAQVSSPSLQWMRSPDGNAWSNVTAGIGATSAIYAFQVLAGDTGAQFRCQISNGCGSLNTNIVTISGCTPPSASGPTDQTATANTQATFSVTGSGTTPLLYQWQDSAATWVNVPTGGTAATYSFTAVSNMSGTKYRCVVTGQCGVPYVTKSAILSVCTPPTAFSSQPASQTKMVGDNAVFSVTLPAGVSSPQYQWQRSPDGVTWANAAGTSATMPSCTLAVVATDNGAKFRCMVTNSCGLDTSAVATLSICTQPVITTPPANLPAVATMPASFTVAATGSGTLSYQWQSSVDGGVTWNPIAAGGNAATYTFTPLSSQNGWQYRCVVSNGCGIAATSSAATLSVCTMPTVVLQPGNQNKNIGDSATFTISATGSFLTYQWQRSQDGIAWSNITTAGSGDSTTTYTLVAAATDANVRFRCMAQNECGKDSSQAAVLIVCLPPQISAQPRDTGVVVDSLASFSVAIVGTNVAYQWQRSDNSQTWSDLTSFTNSSFSISTAPKDDGAKFRCVIKTKCGDTVTSAAALAVWIPVSLDSQFVTNKSVLTGDSVSFRVVAHGTNLVYAWQKKASGASAFLAITDTAPSYTFAAQQADSASSYRCIVSGRVGVPCTTSTAQVLVYVPLHAGFKASVTSGQAPLVVQFTDTSTGAFTVRVWDFGDGSKFDSVASSPAHTYATAGAYTPKLTVSGPAPRGTSTAQMQILTWNPGDNPLQISGTFVPPQKVIYTITSFDTIAPPSPLVGVDSVILWYKAGGLPQTVASATYLKGYTVATLKERGTHQYTDSTVMPPLTGSDSVYGFMTSVRWKDGKLTTFGQGNGMTVLMKDTTPVANQLIISGTYVPDDTARITLDNVASIDTSRVSTVGVWYNLTAGTPNFKDTVLTKWIAAGTVVAAGAKFSMSIVNSQFNNVKTTMYAAVVLVGKNGRQSPVKQASFSVGKDRPANPVHLVAKGLSASRIRLSWNNVASTGIEKMIIWYRTGQAVPKIYDFSSAKLDSLVPLVGDTFIVGDKFSGGTKYYFGAQVYKGGLWSYVTDSSSASDSTWAAGSKLDSNTCAVSRLYLDTATNQIRVCWTVDPAQAESLQVGILYSTSGVPATNTNNQQVVDVKAAKDSAYVKLRENLMFDTTYYVSLWLRRSQGSWTDPTSKAVDSLKIKTFTWQSITYFSRANDTVSAFNNEVRLTNTPGDQSQTQNVVTYRAPAGASAIGLVPVSVGIEFQVKAPGIPLNIALRVDSLPQGSTMRDVRIYHRTAAGEWVIDDNPLTIDSAGKYVSVLTNQLDLPFFAMVDTRIPTVSILSPFANAAVADSGYVDSLLLTDNIANLKWWFLSARGGSAYATGDTSQFGELSDTSTTLVVKIPGDNVNQDNGVRAILIVSDGVHLDTVDLSRSVARSTSGVVHTDILKWTPLSTAMVLDTPQLKSALSEYADKGSWTYDNRKFRLFRWNSGGGSWQEFADADGVRGTFDFARGNLVWIKTLKTADVTFGSGITPSLAFKDQFVLACAPNSWTDFGLPYKFDMAIGDILNASKSGGGKTDSLGFYTWKKDSRGVYHSAVQFMKALGDSSLSNEATALVSGDLSGFTVFNPYADTVFLHFPPIPQAMSTAGLSKQSSKSVKKTPVEASWSVRIASRLSDSTELSPVYCGFSKSAGSGTSYYPAAPSFVNSRVGVFNMSARKMAGHAMAHSAAGGGCAFLVAFDNESDKPEKMSYHLENLRLLPSGVSAEVFNANTQRFEDLSHGDATIPLGPNSRDFRWLLVGPKEYLAKASMIARPALLALVGTYPNPFRTMVRIRYELPYEGIDKLRFFIFDLRGRVVWHSDVPCATKYGPTDLVWNTRTNDNRPVAAGIYLLKMVALNGSQKIMGTFERKMTFVP